MTIAAGLGNRFPIQFISICQLRQINYTYSDLCCNPTAPCSEPQWPCPQDMPWNSELVSRSRHVDEPEHTCPPRNRGEKGSFGWLLLRQSAKLFLNSCGQSNGGVRSMEHGARSWMRDQTRRHFLWTPWIGGRDVDLLATPWRWHPPRPRTRTTRTWSPIRIQSSGADVIKCRKIWLTEK